MRRAGALMGERERERRESPVLYPCRHEFPPSILFSEAAHRREKREKNETVISSLSFFPGSTEEEEEEEEATNSHSTLPGSRTAQHSFPFSPQRTHTTNKKEKSPLARGVTQSLFSLSRDTDRVHLLLPSEYSPQYPRGARWNKTREEDLTDELNQPQ